MIVDRFVEKLPVNSNLAKLMVGSLLTALGISLGMVVLMKWLGFPVDPGIPSAFAAVGAALYAAKKRK